MAEVEMAWTDRLQASTQYHTLDDADDSSNISTGRIEQTLSQQLSYVWTMRLMYTY